MLYIQAARAMIEHAGQHGRRHRRRPRDGCTEAPWCRVFHHCTEK